MKLIFNAFTLLKMLTIKDIKRLKKIASAIIPLEQKNKVSLDATNFEVVVKAMAQKCAPLLIFFVQFSLGFINLSLILRHLSGFSSISESKLTQFINSWSQSRSFVKYLLLRPILVLIYTSYYSDTKVAEGIGYIEKVIKKPIADFNFSDAFLTPEKDTISTEICIIGSGAGGAVIAKELAEKKHEVLIIEEGDYYSRSYFNRVSSLERNQSLYRDAGLVTTIGMPMILLPTGKALGGTTIINSGTCFRTPSKVLDDWMRRFDLTGISRDLMDPYFERVESIIKVNPVADAVLGGNNLKIATGVNKLNLDGFPLVRNAHNCEGTGACIFGCPTGAKQSVERNYLPLAVSAGAKILKQAKALRFSSKNNTVSELIVKVSAENGGSKQICIRAKHFIVACGTLESPLLLKRSGLANRSGELGRNLSLHPTAKMMGLFDDEIKGDFGVPQGYGIRDYEEQGMMFESVFFPPWLLATSIFQSGNAHWEIMKNYKKIGIFGFLVHDTSKGSVREGPGGRPLIFYSLGKREKDLFVEGLKILGRLFFAAGAKRVYPTLRTMHEITNMKQLEDLNPSQVKRQDLESAAFHPLGTCRMGGKANKSVVNEHLKVHGMSNLWVVDGSVLPTSLGVNPQVTIMAFATRAAEYIHANY